MPGGWTAGGAECQVLLARAEPDVADEKVGRRRALPRVIGDAERDRIGACLAGRKGRAEAAVGVGADRLPGGAEGDGERFVRRRAALDHDRPRSEEHTSELQSLMRISYAVFCLKKKITPLFSSHPLLFFSFFFSYTSYIFFTLFI